MAKKVKEQLENESVVVNVENDVTSVSSDVTASVVNDGDSHCGIDAFADGINEVPKSKVVKSTSAKKVKELALERKIAEMEKSLASANDAVESAAADNERLADELGVANAEVKSLRKELSKCKQDYKKCQGDNRANSALVETLNGELTRLKVRNEELMGTISRLQSKIKEYADELLVKDKDLEDLNFFNAMRAEELSEYKSMSLWQRIKFVFLKDKIFVKKK